MAADSDWIMAAMARQSSSAGSMTRRHYGTSSVIRTSAPDRTWHDEPGGVDNVGDDSLAVAESVKESDSSARVQLSILAKQ